MEIALRRWEAADADQLAALCDGVDRRYLSDRLPSPYTRQDAENWLGMVAEHEGKDGIFRAIMLDGELVGMISVEQKGDVYRMDAELGYSLCTAQWSKGIMTEAVRQACLLAFGELDIVRITGMVYEANRASRKVLERNGFVLEGTLRNAVVKNGQIQNLCVYGKLK